jgi:hypothetical protein
MATQGSWAKRSICRAIALQWSEWHRQHSLDSIPFFPTSGRPYRRSSCLRPAAVTFPMKLMSVCLVIVQFAFRLVLLIGAGLLLHSMIKFGSVQPGFDVAHSISIQPIQGTYSPNPMLIARLRERLQATPGAGAVAAAMREPLRGSLPMAHVSTGPPQFRVLDARYNEVTPEYFSTLEIPFVRGRAFTMEEARSGAPVAVISEATAKRFWPGDDPIGKTFEVTTPEYSSGGRELFLTVPEPSR